MNISISEKVWLDCFFPSFYSVRHVAFYGKLLKHTSIIHSLFKLAPSIGISSFILSLVDYSFMVLFNRFRFSSRFVQSQIQWKWRLYKHDMMDGFVWDEMVGAVSETLVELDFEGLIYFMVISLRFGMPRRRIIPFFYEKKGSRWDDLLVT